MRQPGELSKSELEQFTNEILDALFSIERYANWEWSPDTLDMIGQAVTDYDLWPEKDDPAE